MRKSNLWSRGLVFVVAAMLGLAVNGLAQYGTANLVGTVTDASGAVVPNVKVTVVNGSKGYVRNLVTDATGSYAITNIPIGTYSLTFEAKGFEKVVQTGVSLTTGQTQRVNAKLKVGAVTTEVTVQGNLPHVQTETAAISSVITGQQISQLEINGRDFVRLALLVPGATPEPGLNTTTVGVYANNSISFNGSRMQYNNWTVDGAPNTDEGSASTFNTYPNLDSIAEFRISTSNYGAEYGHHAGAQIDVVTKSGTSKFHGDVSEYFRNDALDAQNFFTNRNNAGSLAPPSRAELRQNEYGWTLGGPFFIPGIYNTKKNKTFFFWSEDWRKIIQGNVLGGSVPSLPERTGDFSQCDPYAPGGPKFGTGAMGVGNDASYNATVASGCTLPKVNGVVYDNINSVPGINPQAVTNANDFMAAYFPKPNIGTNPIGWTSSTPSSTNWREDQIRVDQNIGSKTRVFVRFTHDAWNTVVVPTMWNWNSYDTVQTGFLGPGKSAVLNITNTFSPTVMNEFIAGYTEDWITLHDIAGADSAGLNRPSNFQLAHFFPANNANPELPNLAVCGGQTTCVNLGGYYSGSPWNNSNPIVDLQDNITVVHGNHILKFGAFLEDYHKNEQFGAVNEGALQYGGGWDALSSGNGLADLFLGQTANYTEGTNLVNGIPLGGYGKGHYQDYDFEPYFEDDWHVTPKLTLNLGLRYYLFTHTRDISATQEGANFLPQFYKAANEATYSDASGNTLAQGTGFLPIQPGNGLVVCGQNGIPISCQTNRFNNWAPRFGFAYRLGHNTSVRGGYGIFYEIGNGNESQVEGGEGNLPVYFSASGGDYPNLAAIQPVFDPTTKQYTVGIPPGSMNAAFPYSQKWPSEQQFSMSVEHQFGNANLLSLAYVGELGRHLARGVALNYPALGLGTVSVPQLAGNSFCPSGNCDVQNYLIHEAGSANFFTPYRGYVNSGVTQKGNSATSNYNSLQAEFRHTFGHGLTADLSYTWAHNLDNQSTTYTNQNGNWTEVNPTNYSRFYGTSSLNRTQVFTASYIYYLPFFKNASNAFVREAVGGWEVSGITSLFTGTPTSILCGVSGYSTGIGGNVMCNTVGPLKISKGTDTTSLNATTNYGPITSWFNPAVIAQPNLSQFYSNSEPGMFGYSGRNVITGPGSDSTDLALLKNWKIPQLGEGGLIQFRWETFNTFNQVNWTGFNAGCSSNDTFGQTCNQVTGNDNGNGDVNSAGPARVMQFGLEIKW